MDYDEKNADELEAELYSRIHHDKPEAVEAVVNEPPVIQYNRTVTKHSVVNVEKCNPNPFASAMNNQIPKRITPFTSYLSQVDSQPIDLPPVQVNKHSTEIELNEHRPNPFNRCFNLADEKMKRFQLMQAQKVHVKKIRENIQQKKEATVDENGHLAQSIDSDSDDEVYIYPPEEPTIISIDDEDDTEANNVTVEKEPASIDNSQDDGDDINVDYDKRLSRHYDPFGGIDVAHLNAIFEKPSNSLAPVDKSSDHFAKPQRANRQSLKRSNNVSETDFAATDVYESESSDLPESNMSKGRRKVATVRSESQGSDIDTTTKRSKRMRKRKSSGSNRGSDCIISEDTDDDGEAYIEPEKTARPYYLHRGEGVFNAVTKYSKRYAGRQTENRDVNLAAIDSSDESQINDAEEEEEQAQNDEGNRIVTDSVDTNARKIRKEAEIERLTDLQLTLHKLKEHIESIDTVTGSSVDDTSDLNKNAVWSWKCKDIVEQCRQKHIKSSKVVDNLNTVLEKASRNQLSYTDYKNLEKILHTLNLVFD